MSTVRNSWRGGHTWLSHPGVRGHTSLWQTGTSQVEPDPRTCWPACVLNDECKKMVWNVSLQ